MDGFRRKIEMDDNINSIKQFLNEFREINIEENVKYRNCIISSYYMNPEDVKAEVLDWSLHYLEQKKCPYSLALTLAKLVAHQLSDSIYEMSLQAEEGIGGDDDKKFRYESSQLYTEMIECLSEACINWQDHVDIDAIKVEPPPHVVSSSAIKNTRRKMEDRHVIIHDLNAICGLKDAPRHSYYAVFDGHAGVESASYCAAHLHWNITNHPEFLTNTEKAISEAVILTDRNLLERLYREGIKGGCTALCCLIRDRVMYIAWVGDSQAVLVKQGISVPIGLPHKPDREDERCRVEELGGCILFLGTWRVNGTLAVSRALGDAEHKPYISNEPEVLKIPLDGTEDYIILACDGLWDQLQPSDVGQVVYNHIIERAESVDKVASELVQLSKSQGSTDNITTIVVFLKDPLNISKSESVFPQFQNEYEEKNLQVSRTSPSDTFLNSEKIIKQTANTADLATNGVSTAEQSKNEVNSLNFPQSTIESVALSHLQEKTSTSEISMQQYEHSYISPELLTCENPLLQNYDRGDTTISYAQTTPTNVSNSVNCSVSQISDSFDLNQHIIINTEQQPCINQNVLENASNSLTNLLNSANIYTKDTANLNQLVTVGTDQNIGEPNVDILLEVSAQLSDKEVSRSSNDFIELEEKSESSNEAIMQPTTDLQGDATILLPDMNKIKIIQMNEELEEAVFRNSEDVLNSQISKLFYKKDTESNITSPNNYDSILGHTGDLCKEISNVAINNNFQTETKVSNNNLLHSTNEENSYKQEATSTFILENYFDVVDDKLNSCNESNRVVNHNNHHSATEDLNIDLDEKKPLHIIDMSNFDKNDTVSELPSTHDSITANKLKTHNKIYDVALADNLQVENKVSLSALGKSNCVLHSMSKTNSDKLETTVEFVPNKCANIIEPKLNLCDKTVDMALNNNFQPEVKVSGLIYPIVSSQENKQLEESEISSNNLNKEDLLLYSMDTPDFNRNESVYELPSQNCNIVTANKLALYNKVDNTIINNNLQPENLKNDVDKSNFSFHSINETVSEKLEIVPTFTSENTDSGLNLHNKNDNTLTDNSFQPAVEVCSHSLNKGDRSLHSIDVSDKNFRLVPELSSQDCAIITAGTSDIYQNADIPSFPQPNTKKFSTLDLKNKSETCLSPSIVDTDMLHNQCKITDISLNVQMLSEQDVTENNISVNSCENIHSVPPSLHDKRCKKCPNKSEAIDEVQPQDDFIIQPKCDQVEKIPIFESSVNQVSKEISNLKISTDSSKGAPAMEGNAIHSLPHIKESLIKYDSNNKIIYTKKSTIKELTTISSTVGSRKHITPKPAKSSSLKPMQAQQLKVKQIATKKDKTICEPGMKSPLATKPKLAQPNVFERLSSPKVTIAKPKEDKNRESFYSSKRISGAIIKTVPDASTKNNFSQSNKTLGAMSKRFNTQPHVSENVKSKIQTHSAIINNNEINTKTHKPPIPKQITISKVPRENISHKIDDKSLHQPEIQNTKKKSSNNTDVVDVKKTNSSASRQDITKHRSLVGSKMPERILVNTSSRQATPFRPSVATKLDTKQGNNISNLQSCNSKIASVRNARAVVERSSNSSTKMKERKTDIKSAIGQKKESNAIAKMGKRYQIQKPSSSNHKRSSMPNMDGQGDCIAANKDSHLPEVNGKDIELPKSNTSNSKEVPNPTLHG